MNERIRLLALQAGSTHKQNLGVYQFYTDELEKFAELIVRMCADAADMYEGNGYYVGDCVAEYMGYGAEEGVTEWRAK
jgi:hypothetical protein